MELTDYELEIVSGGGGFGQSGESVRYRALCKTPVKEYPNNRAGALRTIDAGQVIDRCGYPTLGNDGLSWVYCEDESILQGLNASGGYIRNRDLRPLLPGEQ